MTTPSLQLWLHGLAVLGQGLANWPQARAVLRAAELAEQGLDTRIS